MAKGAATTTTVEYLNTTYSVVVKPKEIKANNQVEVPAANQTPSL